VPQATTTYPSYPVVAASPRLYDASVRLQWPMSWTASLLSCTVAGAAVLGLAAFGRRLEHRSSYAQLDADLEIPIQSAD
jgi:hypothetical protein